VDFIWASIEGVGSDLFPVEADCFFHLLIGSSTLCGARRMSRSVDQRGKHVEKERNMRNILMPCSPNKDHADRAKTQNDRNEASDCILKDNSAIVVQTRKVVHLS
jgi:hypothetical protein